MDQKKERLKEIVKWMELKGIKLTAQDIQYLEGVISLATNDGYRAAAEVTRQTLEGFRR